MQRAVDSATELTKAMRKSILAGERINMDALLADKGLATAQRDLYQAKYNYTLALLRLKQQAGTLSIEDLEKIAHYFERDETTPQYVRTEYQGKEPVVGKVEVKTQPSIVLPDLLAR